MPCTPEGRDCVNHDRMQARLQSRGPVFLVR